MGNCMTTGSSNRQPPQNPSSAQNIANQKGPNNRYVSLTPSNMSNTTNSPPIEHHKINNLNPVLRPTLPKNLVSPISNTRLAGKITAVTGEFF